MADALLEMKKAKLRMLKEMTAPRRMDVRVTDALMMMNRLTQKMSGSQKKSTQVMRNMMETAETLEAVKKTLTREKKSTTVMFNMMTVPKDSFVLPFRTDFIS